MTIGVFFAIHDFKVFVEVFENDGRARDCLEPADRRDQTFIQTVDDFETRSPLAVEGAHVVPFKWLC